MIIIIYSKIFFNLDLDAERTYNCDESGFPTNQTNGKCITVKGNSYKLSFRARWENRAVSAVVNAAGIALDPLIIFKGKNLMELWFGANALPDTYYSKSDKWWMDSEAFVKWFEKFCKDVKERPLIIFDGHMTHVTKPVITLAMKENVILIKFPPHSTLIFYRFLIRLAFHPWRSLGKKSWWTYKHTWCHLFTFTVRVC